MKNLLFLLTILGAITHVPTSGLFAQNLQNQVIQLQWRSEPITFGSVLEGQIQCLSFEGASYRLGQHPFPVYTASIALTTAGQPTVKIRNAQYETLDLPPSEEAANYILPDVTPIAALTFDRRKPFVVVSFVPIRRKSVGGGYEKLLSCELEISINPASASPNKGNRSYTENSILNQGTFYQFRVSETGVCKIDHAFLQKLGITDAVNINNLRIYGNGDGMLPELSGTLKQDDLRENPIQTVDNNNNGIIDDGDYALFFARSPHKWDKNSTGTYFERKTNIYSDYNYYFLNTDIGVGKRIATQNPPNEAANQTANTYNDYIRHEKDLINLNYSGRQFHGEEFNGNLSQDFSFVFPNLDLSAPITVRTAVAARSTTNGVSFNVSLNNEPVHTQSIGSVGISYIAPFGKNNIALKTFAPNELDIADGKTLNLNLTFNRSDPNARGWLDYIELNVRRRLSLSSGQLLFRDLASTGAGKITHFVFDALPTNAQIWDVSLPDEVALIPLQNNGFVAETALLREFVAFGTDGFVQPEAIGRTEAQNLHAPDFPDMVIVSAPEFLAQADELAQFHRDRDALTVKVTTPQQIYNEFSSGTPDISAIRDYMKMHYDRANGNEDQMPHYLLLFGDASFDYKSNEISPENNTNFVPTYESNESLITTGTYCTDDFFGYMDDEEGAQLEQNGWKLDIAIGRLPVKSTEEAQIVVNKIKEYVSPKSYGDWRTKLLLIADDEDGDLHFEDAEKHATFLKENYPKYNLDKVYLDAYTQVSGAGGARYPEVNAAFDRAIFNGTLIANYIGHGGERGWAHESILTINQMLSWKNKDKYPLFITATCSVGRYDNPSINSGGEVLITIPNAGGIGAMTTTRLVYAGSNQRLNSAFLKYLFELVDGKMPTMGEVARSAKNYADSQTDPVNTHKFSLLGDPALQLAYPRYQIHTTNINNKPIATQIDTIGALEQVTIEGEVRDETGNLLSDFNGTIYPKVYDKISTLSTKANDPPSDDNLGSTKRNFDVRRNIIFRGKATVSGGRFSFTFIAPRDINYEYGIGRVSYYAENGSTDADGFTESVVVGGISAQSAADPNGPEVGVFMNDEKFVSGGTTDENPVLLVKLKDQSGLNTVGNSIGHDLTAMLDNETQTVFVLNEYYQADKDSYQSGTAVYPLSNLSEGWHSVTVKAWDVHNQSGKGYAEFVVAKSAELALSHVINYPNPFTDHTNFWFEHNKPGVPMTVTVQVLTLSGRVVKTLQRQITPDGYRIDDISWDGLDDFGNKIGRGTYIYQLNVTTQDQQTARKIERLVILK